jgi:hypothetical protein
MSKGCVPLLAAVLALVTGPTSALASPSDIAATQTYIRANYTLVHAGGAKVGTGEAAVTSLLRKIQSECPKAASASPENQDAEQLSDEVIGAMTIVAFHAAVPAILAFVHAVAPLRWSNPRLTRTVAAYASKLKALTTLAAPNLCADVRTWTTSGFHTLSPSTTRFDQLFSKVDVALGEVPARLLAPYERPSETATLDRTKRLEDQLTEAEARAVESWGKILEALALNP